MKLVTRLFVVILVLNLLLPGTPSQASSPVQQTAPKRSPEVLRDILIHGDPMAHYRPGESTQVDPPPSADGPVLPTWGRFVIQSYLSNSWKLYTTDFMGGSRNELATGAGTPGYPALQKNGQEIAFTNIINGNNDINTIRFDGSGLTRITENSADDVLPAWSPDGSRIVFQSTRTGNSDIFVMNKNGSGLVQLTNSTTYDGEANWSPDGRQIVFVSNRSGTYDLWAMNADGGYQRPLTQGVGATTPDWSPKGDRIAFGCDQEGDGFFIMCIFNFGGSQVKQFAGSFGGTGVDTWAPAWSPDGAYIGAIRTFWMLYNGQWYWTSSSLSIYDPVWFDQLSTPIQDETVWRVDWAANDTQAPGACQVTSSTERATSGFPIRFVAIDQGPSGIAAYDAHFRLPGGNWQNLTDWNTGGGAIYTGADVGQVEFRCRAYDRAGNVGAWSAVPTPSPVVDAIHPKSQAFINQSLVRGKSTPVLWSGEDKGSGIANYDVFSKDGTGGNWTWWQTGTTATQAVFTGESGHTYYFRSQAHDQVGHTQNWEPQSQAEVTFYATQLTLPVTDARGNIVPSSSITLDPPAVTQQPQNSAGEYRYWLREAASHTLNLSAGGFGTLPAAHIPTTVDANFHWVLPPQNDLVLNGGFEAGSLTPWSATGEGASLSTAQKHTGLAALQLTHAAPATTTLTQTLTIGGNVHQPTLSFLYHIPAGLTDGNFIVEVIGTSTTTVLSTQNLTAGWTATWADLSAYSGQAITLSIRLDGAAGTVLVDEVSVGGWNTPVAESVNPNAWPKNQSTAITILGNNFIATPQVYLNEVQIASVTWVSTNELTVNVPATLQAGVKQLKIVNPGGASSVMFDAVEVQAWQVYLPVVPRSVAVVENISNSDWPMERHDPARTNYNSNAVGGTRYHLEWVYEGVYSPIISDGILLTTKADYQHKLTALDAQTGIKIWEYDEPQTNFGPLAVFNGIVYTKGVIVNTPTKGWAFNLYNGNVFWITDQNLGPFPLVVGNQVIANVENGISALNASTGANAWYTWYNNFSGASKVSYYQGVLYSLNRQGFQAIDPKNGEILWSLPSENHTDEYQNPPIISNGIAILMYGIYKIAAVDLATHQVLWSSENKYYTGATLVEGAVYLANASGLEVRSSVTGELFWSRLGATIPTVTSKYLYLPTNTNTLVLDRFTNEVVGQIDQVGSITAANGFLYFYDWNKYQISAYRVQEP